MKKVMFPRESGLMFSIFAQFLSNCFFFQRGMGSERNFKISETKGGFVKMEKPESWGVLSELPYVVGVWIFSGSTQFVKNNS